jgi:hypothetical protein
MADENENNDTPNPEAPAMGVPADEGTQAAKQPKNASEPTIPPEVERALRKANKEAETLRLKLREFEDRDKSEAEKLADRAETAEKRAAEAEQRLLRSEVAAEKGLTAAQARRLVGSTREELEADADDLLASFGTPADGGKSGKGRAAPERLRPGGMPNPKPPTLAEQIAAAEKSGDWAKARQLKTQQLVELATGSTTT